MSRPSTIRDVVPMPRGWFRLEVRRHGRLVEVVDEPNVIVVGAAWTLAGLLAGTAALPGISRIGFGTSMVPAVYGNTALTAPFYKAIDGVVPQPDPAQCCISFSLGAGEANGMSIGEFGLFSPAGVLFARKTRTFNLIPKDATVSLAGTWSIQFGASP